MENGVGDEIEQIVVPLLNQEDPLSVITTNSTMFGRRIKKDGEWFRKLTSGK